MTWSEGYRQPSLEELFSAPISTLQGTRDPLFNGLFEPETNTLVQSNKNLQPEDSRSFSAGFVYTPKYVPGLTMSVDFWDTERTGIVAVPLAQQVVDRAISGTYYREKPWNAIRLPIKSAGFCSQTRIWVLKRLAGMTLLFNTRGKRLGERSRG